MFSVSLALPASTGASLARPDTPIVCLVGDGGLQFTLGELAGPREAGAWTAIMVWNNHGYGEIKDSMERAHVPPVAVDTSARDFLRIAEGFGCRAVRAESLDALPGIIGEAFALFGVA